VNSGKPPARKSKDFNADGSCALSFVVLHFCNASLEKEFTVIALINSKLRNGRQLEKLESILCMREFISRKRICCDEFKPTKHTLQLFTPGMYTMADDEHLG